jgi:hypothetical protein
MRHKNEQVGVILGEVRQRFGRVVVGVRRRVDDDNERLPLSPLDRHQFVEDLSHRPVIHGKSVLPRVHLEAPKAEVLDRALALLKRQVSLNMREGRSAFFL